MHSFELLPQLIVFEFRCFYLFFQLVVELLQLAHALFATITRYLGRYSVSFFLVFLIVKDGRLDNKRFRLRTINSVFGTYSFEQLLLFKYFRSH